MQKRILLALGDKGSYEYIRSCLPSLARTYGLSIVADPDGAAITDLEAAGIRFLAWDGGPLDTAGVSLILCGTCGKAQKLWRAATLAGQEARIPVAWFGDFFGSGAEPALADLSPDAFAAFDQSSVRRFLDRRPAFRTGRIEVVGNPAFDELPAIVKTRMDTRKRLGLSSRDTFVRYAASSLKQFDLAETLTRVAGWVERSRLRFAVGFHPADEKSAAEDVHRLRSMLRSRLGSLLVDTKDAPGIRLSAAADLVVTDYSTEGVKSALMGVPTVFVMLDSARAYQRSRGGTEPFFPILEKGSGVALPIFSVREFARLDAALVPMYRDDQKKALRDPRFSPLSDGKAGERFTRFVRHVLD